MKATAFACLAALCLSACATAGRHGAIDASPFEPVSDQSLERVLGGFPSPGESASRDVCDALGNVVAFPAERATYADSILAYQVGSPSPIPEGQDRSAALGRADYTANTWERPHAVSLGNGGSIALAFGGASLVDGDGPDLFIFEVGPSVEGMLVDVSADGEAWVSVGEARGGACSVDIGPHVQPEDVFHYVRIRDIPHQGAESDAWPGADIDAVAMVGASRRVALPSEVLFDFDSDVLSAGAPAVLDGVVASIAAGYTRDTARVTVQGHTDDLGAEAYNLALSQRRAEAVAAYFEGRGIARSRLAVEGWGEQKPAVANDDDAQRRQNRRVEILIHDR